MRSIEYYADRNEKAVPVAAPMLEMSVHQITEALQSARYTSGSTHGFYHYPARFSPDVARTIIETFSRPNDYILDPFMGGGTAVVEGLALGRRVIGSDINALAHFVVQVRTRPLSRRDEMIARQWADTVAEVSGGPDEMWSPPGIQNLPSTVETFMARALSVSDVVMPLERQRAFARCALLRLGQWALDCRDFAAPRRSHLAHRLPELVEEMLEGMQVFVADCKGAGVEKRAISGRRVLLCRSAVGLESSRRLQALRVRPRLVFTSPPYPGVHVLYHRWQYRGRKETAAPYWIARVPDGYYESHYMGGSRTPTGEARYFQMIVDAFTSIRQVLATDGVVTQIIGFNDTKSQLPRYLEAMEQAGFEEWRGPDGSIPRLDRRVPNRKWYAKLQDRAEASTELLLLHRPVRG